MGREFPYTPQGMAAARQYSQAMGMRDGGSMGFRPVGYADGDLVMDPQTRSAIIEKLMDMTGMGANTFVGLSNEQLTAAVQKVEADALAAQTQQLQQMQERTSPSQRSAPSDFLGAPSDLGNARGPSDRDIDQILQMQQLEKGANAGGVEGFLVAPQQIPNFPGVVPNEQGDGYNYYSPSEPTGMYNGGLMSLRRR
jgi:hypothetical protein